MLLKQVLNTDDFAANLAGDQRRLVEGYDDQGNGIMLFEPKQVRSVWDAEKCKWHFAVIDVVSMLTASSDPGAYWRKLKERLKKEGNETVTNCHGLKMTAADGKQRLTDVADAEQLLRLIQYPGNEFPVYAPCVLTGRATLAVP